MFYILLFLLFKYIFVAQGRREIPAKLIWKEKKQRSGRLNKKKIIKTARKHLLYGFLTKPTRIVGKIAILIFLVGLYELHNVIKLFLSLYSTSSDGFWRDFWPLMVKFIIILDFGKSSFYLSNYPLKTFVPRT